ncbi:MAG: precorrin-6y C5,15-methyltransferase (decarboxylating) subunit CbiE, partial [Planctomycetota bacterium]
MSKGPTDTSPPTGPEVPIIGIGDDGPNGLTAHARKLLQEADVILGDARDLTRLPQLKAELVPLEGNLDDLARKIESQDRSRRLVVLTSGDPLFYGVARYLGSRLGKQRFTVIPHVSSMQLAFARVMESWEDAYLTNLAHRDLHRVVEQIRSAEKVGLFTTPECSPAAVAQSLVREGIEYFTAYVCENLSGPDERVTQGELREIAEQQFDPLN